MKLPPNQIYLFSDIGLNALKTFVDASTLFVFDLDGTLAAIVENPQQIEISTAIKKELAVLKTHAALAILTGRSREDAQRHLRLVPDYLVGNHGAEGLPGWEERLDEFRSQVAGWERQLFALLPAPAGAGTGIFIENKGASLSIHYRGALDQASSHKLVLCAVDQLEPRPRSMSGIFTVNLLPEAAPDKGRAIIELMRRGGHPKGFFAGDDVTDEDVFRLKADKLFSVRIGVKRESEALYYLKSQQEMLVLLRQINAVLRSLQK